MTNSHARLTSKTGAASERGRRPRAHKGSPRRETPALRLGTSSPEAGARYAGGKWGDAPAPAALPRPPTHWTALGCRPEPFDFALGLKMLLNVRV